MTKLCVESKKIFQEESIMKNKWGMLPSGQESRCWQFCLGTEKKKKKKKYSRSFMWASDLKNNHTTYL